VQDYDFVFNVEIYEDKPPLKLPYNIGQDPWMAAHSFLENNNISQLFLDQVASFIQQQTAGITLGAETPPNVVSDPFTGKYALKTYAVDTPCKFSRTQYLIFEFFYSAVFVLQ
jgi:PFU (PLAA family ubiquitin binding)